MTNGYEFYFKDGTDVLNFPITPDTLSMKVGSNNKVVNLISEGDINILKSPSLTEIEFEARFPMRQYPYARKFQKFQTYYDKFSELKEKKKSFRFIVARTTPNGKRTWDTNILVSLEEFELSEDAEDGDDVIVSFTLKQFKYYGVKVIKTNATTNSHQNSSTSTSNEPRGTDDRTGQAKSYTVKKGDCLWNISKRFYGDGSKWKTIYNANKSIIEETARKYGKKSSSNGWWIYPNTELTIPAL